MSRKRANWSHAWCFTSFEVVETDYDEWDCRYLIVGAEICPKTGKPHHQGYVYFDGSTSFTSCRALIPRAHWEPARGSPQQSRDYCTKESTFVERGSLPHQGKRTDIHAVREILLDGGNMADVAMVATSYQSARFGELFLSYVSQQRQWAPHVTWIFGPTGSGKTRMAFEDAKDPWVSNRTLAWWDGYCGQSDVIIDDFRGDFCTFHELLRILDRYPYRVMRKGSSTELLARRIWITSIYAPTQVYETREDIGQLCRRITHIYSLDEAGGCTQWQPQATPVQPSRCLFDIDLAVQQALGLSESVRDPYGVPGLAPCTVAK